MRVLLVLLLLAILGAIGAAVGGVWLLHTYGRDLPDYRALETYEPPLVSRFYAGDGRLLAEYATETRIFVPYASMPPHLIDAFVSAEDQRFWSHMGFDPIGIARAALRNIRNVSEGRRLEGASTITQQVAKNFFFSNEVSLERKLKELILALRIEQAYSKEKILELYLNEIYLGARSYGVAAAALNYFNKAIDELTVAEAAYLAALPKAPNNYHPVRQREAAIARRNYVLDRMVADGRLAPALAAAARQAPLTVAQRTEMETATAPYFAEEVRRELIERYGNDMLLEGGLFVRTTVDPRLQQIAETVLRDGLIAYDRRHGYRGPVDRLPHFDDWAGQLDMLAVPPGAEPWRLAAVLDVDAATARVGFADGSTGVLALEALRWARPALDKGYLGPRVERADQVLTVGDVVLVGTDADDSLTLEQVPEVQGSLVALDVHTGRVLAMVGGLSYAASEFNRATQALRQPGSAFKPFVYLTGLELGFTPSTQINDAPITLPQGPNLPDWEPQNYSGKYYGPTPLRKGLERSQNVMTVRLSQYVGLDRIGERVVDFGILDTPPTDVSATLGTKETTVLRLTAAYAMLVNGGKRITPTLLDRVQDRHGTTLFRSDDRRCPGCMEVGWAEQPAPQLPDPRVQLVDPRHAYQIVSMLEGVVQRGTARTVAALDRPLAGKTGTTNDYRDAWFIGFSPDLAVGVQIGFDDNRTLGRFELGLARIRAKPERARIDHARIKPGGVEIIAEVVMRRNVALGPCAIVAVEPVSKVGGPFERP